MKFVERTGKAGKLGEAPDLIRRYDAVIFKDVVQARALSPPLLQGLTIWYRNRPPLKAEIISLTADRSLREDEFNMIQSDVNLPALTSFFSPVGRRVGETWEILPSAVQAVSGNPPNEEGYEMTGTLKKVSKSADGASLVAEIGVAGHFGVLRDPCAFNASIEFTFVPQGVSIPKAVAKKEQASKTVEATGSIKLALLSFVRVADVPETDGRLKHRVTIELIMERRPLAPQPGERGEPSAPLELQPVPKATEENSWITYDDPLGRFHFRHPQELLLTPTRLSDLHTLELTDIRPAGNAVVGLVLPENRGNAERDLLFHDAKHFQQVLEREAAKGPDHTTWGTIGWLEDEDWKTRKRKVFRMEGAVRGDEDAPTVYVDFYLVNEINSSRSFKITAWMGREGGHLAFRKDVEDIIRSFQWSPAEKRPSPPSTAPGRRRRQRAPQAPPRLLPTRIRLPSPRQVPRTLLSNRRRTD